MDLLFKQKLIVTIVNKGWEKRVVDASKKAGAEGGTIIYGRVTGIHEQQTLFGILVEPEKEIILTLAHEDKCDKILEAIVAAAELNNPGTGLAFVLDVEKVAGIVHMMNKKGNN